MKFIANISMCDPTFYVPLAQAAEAAGFDTIAVPDSIAYPKESSSTYPYNFDGTREFLENKPFIEPHIAMAAMSAVTSTIEFHTFVLKMPIRHPVIYAKEATSLAVHHRRPLRARRRHEPVARRLRDRAAAVGRSWPPLRRVHRDRARASPPAATSSSTASSTTSPRSRWSRCRRARSRCSSAVTPTPTCAAPRASATAGWVPAACSTT